MWRTLYVCVLWLSVLLSLRWELVTVATRTTWLWLLGAPELRAPQDIKGPAPYQSLSRSETLTTFAPFWFCYLLCSLLHNTHMNATHNTDWNTSHSLVCDSNRFHEYGQKMTTPERQSVWLQCYRQDECFKEPSILFIYLFFAKATNSNVQSFLIMLFSSSVCLQECWETFTWLSKPSNSSMKKNRTAHSWKAGMVERTSGYTTNTNPGPEPR